jgi:hypothetical protein
VRAGPAPDPTLPQPSGSFSPVTYRPSTAGKVVWIVDGILVLWVVAWILIGLAVARDVRNLSRLSDTVVRAGSAVRETGRALHALENLPFVGDRIGGVARQVDAAADQAVRSGRDSRDSVEHLSVLLGFAVAVIPTVPILAIYAPFRVSRVKEVRAVRKAATQAQGDPMFEEYLAHRAVENLPYHRLRAITPNPWRDLEAGHHSELAEAELARLGLRREARGRRAR